MDMIVKSESLTSVADAIREKGETTEQLIFPSDFVTAIHAINGGGDLNFDVVGGTSEPSNPKENTIWVDTNTEVIGWSFSATEPVDPAEGMVWVKIAVDGEHMINVISENEIKIALLTVNQYIDGAWVGQTAYIYVSGVWKSLTRYLYDKGNLYSDFTGGFELTAWPITSSLSATTNNVSLTYDDDQIVIKKTGTSSSQNNASAFTTVNKIDLSAYDTLVAKGRFYAKAYSTGYLRLFAEDSKSTPWGSADAAQSITAVNVAQNEIVLNVKELYGSFYIGFGMYTSINELVEIKINEMYLM